MRPDQQLDLFNGREREPAPVVHPRARRTDPFTSHIAAGKAERFAGSHAARLLAELLAHGPGTVDELAARVGLQSQQVNKRLPELEREGRIRATDRTRLSKAGVQERIWEAL